MFNKIFTICALGLAVFLSLPRSALAAGAFNTGWWTSINTKSYLAQYAADGVTLVHMGSGGWYTSNYERSAIKNFLDEAQKYGIKVIVSLTRTDNTPNGVPVQEFTDTINAYKNHPALYAWYVGDEPEMADQARHVDILGVNPGYYKLAKQADPNHDVFISFNQFYRPLDTYWAKAEPFLKVTDIFGMHNYPFWTGYGQFTSSEARDQYDVWAYALNKFKATGKPSDKFIATAQGFGTNSVAEIYRNPSVYEMRYQVFSAIVQGVKNVLFWADYKEWTNTTMKARVKSMIGLIQSIGAEMNNGIVSDPNVKVSITDRNQLAYIHGVNGGRHVIVAVNIAGRTSSKGKTLTGVKFTVPTTKATKVDVLSESRSLPITNNVFVDTFKPFAVHIYAYNDPGVAGATVENAPVSSWTRVVNFFKKIF